MAKAIFITGIGTDTGKTLVSAIITEALQAHYWKPVQAGYENGTDAEWVKSMIGNKETIVFPELYKFKLAASPHIAAREEGIIIDLQHIKNRFSEIMASLPLENDTLIIEGAGGIMVPLNENSFVADLIKLLPVKVILVSRNYLGSINHSLLTTALCKQYKMDVAGWVFNDQYMEYEEEIVQWSGFPKLGSIPFEKNPGTSFIAAQAIQLKENLKLLL